jgi:dihydroorotate dehydrogenase
MSDFLITTREKIIAWKYRYLAKPIFFRLDPEDVHDHIIAWGARLGRFGFSRFLTRAVFNYQHPSLSQEIRGIRFNNPVGLAAGFDKNAQLTDILPAVGFGFEEIGSVTGEACAGNPKPRLWRLPKSESLIVYYGLKNDGAEAIAKRLANKKFGFPIGVSLAKTNSPATVEVEAGIADYLKAYRVFKEAKVGDYFTINISCPNAFGGLPFTAPDRLALLLSAIAKELKTRPIFLKMPPDISTTDLDQIISLAEQYQVDGFISTNLTKDKINPTIKAKIKEPLPTELGGLSGKVVEGLADEQLRYLAQKTQGRFVLIACGGIFTADDAYRKIRAGASLLQLATGMIFQGPQVIGAINHGLVQHLKRDGFRHLSEAVGADLRA